jgi:hypothetical protein
MAEMPDAGETGPKFSIESGITRLSRLKLFREEAERLPRSGRRRPLLQGGPYMLVGGVHHEGNLCPR